MNVNYLGILKFVKFVKIGGISVSIGVLVVTVDHGFCLLAWCSMWVLDGY
jgi:hypothetical protein